jgi:hypothetical protein
MGLSLLGGIFAAVDDPVWHERKYQERTDFLGKPYAGKTLWMS